MSKPCKIPRDLKPGDRLWYSKTQYATVGPTAHWPTCYDDDSIRAQVKGEPRTMVYMLDTGREYLNHTPPIIRIERIASKPKKAKVDRDAKWLIGKTVCVYGRDAKDQLTLCTGVTHGEWNRRLRAIARRLNGAKLP